MAMGEAFGALGGNLSGMSQNPAGSSVFLYTEFGVTAQLTNQNIQTSYFRILKIRYRSLSNTSIRWCICNGK